MSRFLLLTILFVTFLFIASPAQAADEVVGTGIPSSCTEANFDIALATVQNSGGGTITFNCGGMATITFTSGKIIIANTNVTIDGGSQITLSGGNAVRHFYVEGNATLTVKNITLTSGYDYTFGGGSILSLAGTTLTLDNATIRDSNVDTSHSGGAIMSYSHVTITNSLIENNTGGSAGGLFLFGEAADATITGSAFNDNRTTNNDYGLGGAITVWDGADLIVQNSTLMQNQARKGGAVYSDNENTVILIEQNSTLTNNVASGDNVSAGGGIFNSSGSLTIHNTDIADNSSYDGGGIYNFLGNVVITDSNIQQNFASGLGGGIFNDSGSITLTNVNLSSNWTINSGGGIMNFYGQIIIVNCNNLLVN